MRQSHGERQIFLDCLNACGCDVLEMLWNFEIFYDTIDTAVLSKELRVLNYGLRKTAQTLLVHGSPMLIKLNKIVGMTKSKGRGITPGCGRSNGLGRALTTRKMARMRRFAKEKLGWNNLVTRRKSEHLDGSDMELQGGTPHDPPAPHPE